MERFFGSAQDQLVKDLRKGTARTPEEANRYLEQDHLPHWNSRSNGERANPTDAHRLLRVEHHLAAMLSYVEERVVANH